MAQIIDIENRLVAKNDNAIINGSAIINSDAATEASHVTTIRTAEKRKERYARKLSGVERFSMAVNEIHRYNVDGIAVGSGHIDAAELRRAVAAAAQANPGMRVRLQSFLGFAKWVDSGIAPEVIEVDAPDWDFNSDKGAEFLQKRFEPRAGGPIADIIIVRTQEKTGFICRGLHAAVDGRAIMHWGAEVFRALRGEPLIGADSTVADFEVAENFREKFEAGAQAQEKESQQKENRTEAKADSAPVYLPIVPPSATSDRQLRYMWRTVVIPKRITTILPRAAIYLASYARRQGEGNVAFTVPVDFRGLRVEVNSTGNLTGYLRINVSPGDTPKTVMQQINQQIRNYVDCRYALMAKPLRWVPLSMLVHKLNKNRDALLYTKNTELPTGGLVSMGHNDLASYSTPTFKCERMLGIPGSVGKLNIVAVNGSDSTYVTFSAPQNYNREGQLDRLIDEFAAEFSR